MPRHTVIPRSANTVMLSVKELFARASQTPLTAVPRSELCLVLCSSCQQLVPAVSTRPSPSIFSSLVKRHLLSGPPGQSGPKREEERQKKKKKKEKKKGQRRGRQNRISGADVLSFQFGRALYTTHPRARDLQRKTSISDSRRAQSRQGTMVQPITGAGSKMA